ncbi:MAG: hypothetical protein JKY90_02510 [Gammaproteobacteria bacterium]|nr:hypothetical protein [Gammaproteobacteria bacterium]
MTKNEQLGRAIVIACNAHEGQFDKGGNPYILHPLHLMDQLLFDKQLATIAVLHDVVEDSDGKVTIATLGKEGFSERVCAALDLLTHRKGDDYIESYIKRICTSYDAIRVKRKDLAHNSDITRLKGITEKDLKRMEKYHCAFVLLTEAKRNFDRK